MARLAKETKERLTRVEERLAGFATKADQILASLGKSTDGVDPVKIIRGLEKSVAALTEPIRRALLANYQASGVGASPRSGDKRAGTSLPRGWLKKMIQQTTVKLVVKAAYSDNTLIPVFEINLGGKTASPEERTVAASINYGAMHVGTDVREPYNPADKTRVSEEKRAAAGAAAKRSLKALAFTGRISKRALNAIRRGSHFEGVQVTKGLDVNRGTRQDKPGGRAIHLGPQHHVWASLPYPFFYFTTTQINGFSDVVAGIIDQEITNAR